MEANFKSEAEKDRCKKHMYENKTVANMADMNPIAPIINLYVNYLNIYKRMLEWVRGKNCLNTSSMKSPHKYKEHG